jgi:hypothetical protein
MLVAFSAGRLLQSGRAIRNHGNKTPVPNKPEAGAEFPNEVLAML